MKVAFYTLGCKVNQYETNGMIQNFKENNYEIVNFEDVADIYIVNTCTVTNIADRKSRQFLRQAKKNNSKSIIVAVGCYVKVARNIVEQIEEIDLCVDNDNKINIVKIVEDYIENKKIQYDETQGYKDFGDVTYTEKSRAVIKVQDGCDMFCSYCIIPYARGRVRSRSTKSVISEITKISKKGIKEVVITGIHVASYGKDFDEKFDLIDLLEQINKIEGIERIRLGSIEPKFFNDENLERISNISKVVHHFHLSLQSGCTNTLKRMNRKYTAEEFEKIVENIREKLERTILTTDIIVGFPGETEEEFEETTKFLEKIKFFKMHIFKYSQRDGTVASKMPNQVLPQIKEKRSNVLLELSDKNEKEYLQDYIGKKVEVLFEEEKNGYFYGHTDNFIIVKVESTEDISNEIKMVEIQKIEDLNLIGKMLQF